MVYLEKKKKLHFIGIGGIGMSGLAEVFFQQGYEVSGCDLQKTTLTQRLERLGIPVSYGHDPAHLQTDMVVVRSSAIDMSHLELQEAYRKRLCVIPRAEMLAELMRGKWSICVCGSHGKTTTTSMLASVFQVGGEDPTVIVGGRVRALGGNNTCLGTGPVVIAEADESDGSFLRLPATVALVTNIDTDHLDFYGTQKALDQAFLKFMHQLPFYGFAVACGEDLGVQQLTRHWVRPMHLYGFSKHCDYQARNVQQKGWNVCFEVWKRHHKSEKLLGMIEVFGVGEHVVLNALGVVALCCELRLSFKTIQKGLKKFQGVHRRFELKWKHKKKQQWLIEDYGHHPTEIQKTIAAARLIWKGRLLCFFEPHRYSRTELCEKAFLTCFEKADQVWISDIYPASEKPRKGICSKNLVSKIQNVLGKEKVFYGGSLRETQKKVMQAFQKGDLLLCMGAGKIHLAVEELVESLPLEKKWSALEEHVLEKT